MEDPSRGQELVAVVAVGRGTDPSLGAQEEPRQGGLVGTGCEQRGQALSPNPAGAWWHLARPGLGPGEPQEGISGAGMGWREDPQPGSQAGDLGSRENAAGEAAGSCCTSPLKRGWGFLGVPAGLLPHTRRDTSSRAGGCLCNTHGAEGLSCWSPLPAQCPQELTGSLPHGSHPAPWPSPYPWAALAGGTGKCTGSSVWHLGTAPGALFSQGSGAPM